MTKQRRWIKLHIFSEQAVKFHDKNMNKLCEELNRSYSSYPSLTLFTKQQCYLDNSGERRLSIATSTEGDPPDPLTSAWVEVWGTPGCLERHVGNWTERLFPLSNLALKQWLA